MPFMIQRTFRNRRRPLSLGIRLFAGAIGVLAGLQHLLSSKDRTKCTGEPAIAENAVPIRGAESVGNRRHYFSIRRTKSELGYVYWVLQGYGEFQCFVLFDTWREAIEEATARVSASTLNSRSGVFVSAACC